MKTVIACLISAMTLLALDLPEPYRAVSRLIFVVPDADRAAKAWAAAGVPIEPSRQLDGVIGSRVASVLFENVAADFMEAGAKGALRD
jgi:hypothetical protein